MQLDHILRVSRAAQKYRGPGPLAEAIDRVDDDGATIPRLLQAQRELEG